jgi:hypothetical protein
MGDFGILPQH